MGVVAPASAQSTLRDDLQRREQRRIDTINENRRSSGVDQRSSSRGSWDVGSEPQEQAPERPVATLGPICNRLRQLVRGSSNSGPIQVLLGPSPPGYQGPGWPGLWLAQRADWFAGACRLADDEAYWLRSALGLRTTSKTGTPAPAAPPPVAPAPVPMPTAELQAEASLVWSSSAAEVREHLGLLEAYRPLGGGHDRVLVELGRRAGGGHPVALRYTILRNQRAEHHQIIFLDRRPEVSLVRFPNGSASAVPFFKPTKPFSEAKLAQLRRGISLEALGPPATPAPSPPTTRSPPAAPPRLVRSSSEAGLRWTSDAVDLQAHSRLVDQHRPVLDQGFEVTSIELGRLVDQSRAVPPLGIRFRIVRQGFLSGRLRTVLLRSGKPAYVSERREPPPRRDGR